MAHFHNILELDINVFLIFFTANASCERKSLINLVIKTSHMFIKTGIAPPLVIEVPAPNKVMCVKGIAFVSLCNSIFSFICMFCRSLFVLSSLFFSFSCVVCSSSIYGFWLPLWYLQTLLSTIFLFSKFSGGMVFLVSHFIGLLQHVCISHPVYISGCWK